MTRRGSMTLLAGAAVIPLSALAVGCGSSNSGGATASAPPPTTTPAATSARAATVHVASSRLGKILVDSRGRTLYMFKKDKGTKSACVGMCATFWPPLRSSGKPTAGSGAKASLIGTTKRSDGKPQVTYNSHPVYTFVMDKKAGDTNGENKNAFGGRWFAISAAGKQVSPKAAKSSAGSSSSSTPAPAAPKPAAPPAAPKAAPKPAAPKPAPPKASPPSNGIPQNGGGDGDSDNNGGPSDGDGNV
jgi:predicted lipoprotein with Yx(FWY)xxD motif